MSQFQSISASQAFQLLQAGGVRMVDIRDAASFHAAHVASAYHLTNDTLHAFMQETDFDTPVLVICYHGHSSQGAAQYLVNQGYEQVYSVEGGFEGWRREWPIVQANVPEAS